MKHLILPIVLLLAVTSCKKKETSPEPVQTTTGGSTTGGNGSVQSGIGNNAGNLHGYMMANLVKVPTTTMVLSSQMAMFSTSPQPFGYYYTPENPMMNPAVNAGVVRCNSDTVPYMQNGPFGGFYYSYGMAKTLNSPVWNLTGVSPFTTFETTVPRGYPVSVSNSFLPDSVSKTSNLTIQFNANFSNTDSICVFITDNGSKYASKHVAGNATSVTFTPAQFTGFATGNGDIQVIAYNYSNQTVNGKNYIYVLQETIMGQVVIH
ncbi:MAG: hypothetical protein K0S32_2088 [Bacteroidetes bacterium]|jgi:hypothetical protein|nr:hypothetical protein [Bacteroidota bacterium]